MAGRVREKTRQIPSDPVKQPFCGTGVSTYRPGDLLLVRLSSDTAKQPPSVWIRVERCDEQHRIVFGTVDGDSPGLGKALNCGAKLAAGYHQVHRTHPWLALEEFPTHILVASEQSSNCLFLRAWLRMRDPER